MLAARPTFALATLVVAGWSSLLACSRFSSADAPGADAGPEATATAVSVDAGVEAAAVDAGDGFPRSALRTALLGPGGYAIETTEVTNAQFRAFKLHYGPDAGAPWTACSGKVALGPGGGCNASTGDDAAVTCVDWCDANSYCTSIGRRLCGAIGGGGSSDDANVATDEWSRACAGALGTRWPYGPDAMDTVCSTAESHTASAGIPGSFPRCQGGDHGGTAGVFDMSGNAAEWTNACNADATSCAMRGGSFQHAASDARCDSYLLAAASARYDDVGFRCCATPAP